jgi:aminoacrylate peracid reductase
MGMTADGGSPLTHRVRDAMIAFLEQGCRFLEPVLVGDTVRFEHEVIGARGAGMSDKPFRMVSAGAWPDRYTYSPAVRAGDLLFIAGTTATDEHMRIVGPGDIVAQAREIYRKFDALLCAAGGSRRDSVRREAFGGPPYPVATGVVVARLLRPGALIETSAVAVLRDRREPRPDGMRGAS